jgi:peptidoglycan/LPS O-acetylase OafA/YrhL
VFNTPALRFFGKYSYGIYVIHGLLHPWIRDQFPPEAMPQGPLFYAAVAGRIFIGAALSVAGAVLVWHVYEKHFLKLKRFFEYRARTLTQPVRDPVIIPAAPARIGQRLGAGRVGVVTDAN